MPDQNYSEEEVARLLKRAVEKQLEAQQGAPVGVSLTEIRRIAEEAGIDPQFVDAAVLEDGPVEKKVAKWFLGGARSITLNSTLPGELSQEGIAKVARLVREEIGERGDLEVVGRSFDLQVGEIIKTGLSGITENGKTQLVAKAELDDAIGLWYLLTILPAIGVIGAVNNGSGGAFGVVGGILLATLVLCYFLAGFITRRSEKRLERIMNKVQSAASESIQASTPAPLLDLDEEPVQSERGSQERRRVR